MRYGQQGQPGMGGVPPYGSTPGAATGSVRSYGMEHAGAGSSAPAPGGVGQEAYWPGSGGGYEAYPSAALPGDPRWHQQVSQTHPGQLGASGGLQFYGQPSAKYPGTYQMPATSVPQAPPRKSRRGVVIALVVAILAIVVAILLALTLCVDEKSRRQGDAGQLEGKTDAEIQAELDRVVEEGMFNISVASVVEFENGSAEGDLRIENVPGNRYLMRVTLVRNDTGQQLYQTDIIEPDHHIQRDALDVVLPAGSYECTALFEALDPETEEQVGQAAAVITVNVRS